jgi:hypothetical protein
MTVILTSHMKHMSAFIACCELASQRLKLWQPYIMPTYTQHQLLASFEMYAGSPNTNPEPGYLSRMYLCFTCVLVMREVVLRDAGVGLSMASMLVTCC